MKLIIEYYEDCVDCGGTVVIKCINYESLEMAKIDFQALSCKPASGFEFAGNWFAKPYGKYIIYTLEEWFNKKLEKTTDIQEWERFRI